MFYEDEIKDVEFSESRKEIILAHVKRKSDEWAASYILECEEKNKALQKKLDENEHKHRNESYNYANRIEAEYSRLGMWKIIITSYLGGIFAAFTSLGGKIYNPDLFFKIYFIGLLNGLLFGTMIAFFSGALFAFLGSDIKIGGKKSLSILFAIIFFVAPLLLYFAFTVQSGN